MKKRNHFFYSLGVNIKSINIIVSLTCLLLIGTFQIVYAGQIFPHYDIDFNEVGYTIVPTDEVRNYHPDMLIDYTKINDNVYEITLEAPFPYEIRNLRVAGILPPYVSISTDVKYITVINALSADGCSFLTEDRNYDLRLEVQEESLSFLSNAGESILYNIVPSVIVCGAAYFTFWPPLFIACEETVTHSSTIASIVEHGLESYNEFQTDEKIAQYLADNNYYLYEIKTVEYVSKPIIKHVLRVNLPNTVSSINLMIDADLSLNQAYIERNTGSTAVYFDSGNSFDILNLLKIFSVTPSSGSNGTISPNSITTVNSGDSVTYTATPNTGYIVDRWYKNGEEISGSEATQSLTLSDIQEDTTVLVTFKSTGSNSQVYVAGSLNPNPISFSLPAGGYGKFYDIPVQNKDTSNVSVNANLTGDAAGWASMTSSDYSFTLEPNEIKTSRVSIFAPDNASAGTHTLNISYNGTTMTFYILVTVPGEDYEQVIDSGSVVIGGPNWTATNVDIPTNVWNDVDGGFYDHIRLYAYVDWVSTGGYLYLYDADLNYLMSSTSINPTSRVGKDIYWPINKSRLDEDDNTFGIVGPEGINLQLSNFRLVITFYKEAPDIKITKILSSFNANVGENITVTVTAENITEGSTTGFDVSLTDSLPSGITLVSGSLNNSDFGELEEVESRSNVYTIVANQPGNYVLPSARLSYESINGDDLIDESIPVELFVTAGQLITELNVEWPEDTNSENAVFNVLVKEPDGVTPVLDASVQGIIQINNNGTWETVYVIPMGWTEGDQNYTGLMKIDFLSQSLYRAFAIAQKELYTDGQSSIEEWEAPQLVLVPNLSGKTQAQSELDILSANLTVGTITTAESDTIPMNSVVSQNPLAGTEVSINSAVNLVISKGPSPILPTWYYDGDNDEYGDHSISILSYTQPNSYVANNGDCNDSDENIYPGAKEIIGDGIDQDCNGSDLVDNIDTCPDDPDKTDPGICGCGIPDTDSDDDEIPDCIDQCPNNPNKECVVAKDDIDNDGYTENQGDCNDNDGTIYPGATEICNDGIDQDCDGSDLICTNEITIETDGGEVKLESPAGTTLSNSKLSDTPAETDILENVDFPYGIFEFTVSDLTPGGSTTVTFTLPEGAAPNTYYKKGPTPDNSSDHWYPFIYDEKTGTGAVISGNTITLHFVDGKHGDSDLNASNGVIVDPGGPGIKNYPPGGGGGGCFIDTFIK